MTNNFSELPLPQFPVEEYDFQVIVTPLRMILPEATYFRALDADENAARERLNECVDRFRLFLNGANRLNKEASLLTFVTNLIVPQQSAMGRFYGRYDLRNIQYFIENLNREIHEIVQNIANCYIVDFNEIACSLGKQYFLDDNFGSYNHNGVIAPGAEFDYHLDKMRLEPPKPLSEYYEIRGDIFYISVAREIGAMFRTLKQTDQIKLVILDLDDTLWRGVAAEDGLAHDIPMEGWPLGLAEALGILKRRGILLSIASKNSEARIAEIWDTMMWGRLSFADDFVVKKINWRSKVDNIAEILRETNILPSGALFIDDNPVERDAVARSFPGLRTLGQDFYYLRRTLLNSAETQTCSLTNESAAKTEMVRKQIQREEARQALTREEFLATLGVKVRITSPVSSEAPAFSRALELLNKTNQFNTTGKRWLPDEIIKFIADGGRLVSFEVQDRFTSYGTVGLLLIRRNIVEQFVMSCRVFGLGVETAALAHIVEADKQSWDAILLHTAANGPCQSLYKDHGFIDCGDKWSLPAGYILGVPRHITLLN